MVFRLEMTENKTGFYRNKYRPSLMFLEQEGDNFYVRNLNSSGEIGLRFQTAEPFFENHEKLSYEEVVKISEANSNFFKKGLEKLAQPEQSIPQSSGRGQKPTHQRKADNSLKQAY